MKNNLHEKMDQHGTMSLSNDELLTIIVNNSTVAKNIIKECDEKISSLGDNNLQSLVNKGINEKKAAQICAAIELGKRIRQEKIKLEHPKFNMPEAVADYVMEDMRHLPQEVFKVCLTDTKQRLITIKTVSVGSLTASIASPRDVFRLALRYNAANIILIHNHPSGDPTPSQEDIIITNRMVDVGIQMGISVVDHIIIGDGIFVSLAAKGVV